MAIWMAIGISSKSELDFDFERTGFLMEVSTGRHSCIGGCCEKRLIPFTRMDGWYA